MQWSLFDVPALALMPDDNDTDLGHHGHPKCEKCELTVMRLVGLEPHDTNPRASLHTFQCDTCGRSEVIVVTQM